MSGVKGQGDRHRDALYNRARLELAVLDYLDECDQASVATLADTFGMDTAKTERVISDLWRAEVVRFDPVAKTCALAPLPA